MNKSTSGFTIVELLIVVVVIAILAAISFVSFTGIQQRARDSQRAGDIQTITKALELYYLDNGSYPSAQGSTIINDYWSTTADGSWTQLENQLVPKYISKMPKDPVSTPNGGIGPSSLNYAYFSNVRTGACGVPLGKMYILVYGYEVVAQKVSLDGTCVGNDIYYPGMSNFRVVKS